MSGSDLSNVPGVNMYNVEHLVCSLSMIDIVILHLYSFLLFTSFLFAFRQNYLSAVFKNYTPKPMSKYVKQSWNVHSVGMVELKVWLLCVPRIQLLLL